MMHGHTILKLVSHSFAQPLHINNGRMTGLKISNDRSVKPSAAIIRTLDATRGNIKLSELQK